MAAVIKLTGPGFASLAWMKALSLAAHFVSLGLAWGFCRDVLSRSVPACAVPFRPLLYAISSCPPFTGLRWGMGDRPASGPSERGGLGRLDGDARKGGQAGSCRCWAFSAPLCRLDLALTLTVVVLVAAWQAPAIRRGGLILRFGLLLTALGLGLQTGLRWCLFLSDILPNTYYLEDDGPAPGHPAGPRGCLTLWDMAARGWVPVEAVAGLLGVLKAGFQPRVLVAAGAAAARLVATHVWVGGDAWR